MKESLRFPKASYRALNTAIVAAILLLALSILPAPTSASSLVSFPQDEGTAMIKTADGALFVWNASGLYFSLALKGAEIKPLEDPEHIFLSVDGRVLQIQLAAIKNFAPDAKEKRLDDKAILTAHRDWESKYIEELVHSKLTVRTFNAKLSTGNVASMWQFDMPDGMNTHARKQLYLTLVANDYVLMLNSEASAAISDADGRKFLLDTIATLKFSPTPIDVQKLSEAIRAAKP